jgi:RNA polymerase sigma factor (sigma-70 family)
MMSDKEYEELLNEHIGLIRFFANKYKIRNYEKEDLIQEFSMVLLKAKKNYDESKKTSFETFFTTYVKTWVHDKLETQSTQKRGKDVFILNNNFIVETDETNKELVELIPDNINLTPEEIYFNESVFEFINLELDKMNNGHFTKEYLFEGKTNVDIGKKYNVSTSYVNMVNKINREKLKLLLEFNGYLDNLDRNINRKIDEFKV